MEENNLGVNFVRCAAFTHEIIAEVIDLGEAGYKLRRASYMNATPIEGQPRQMSINFMPVLSPFAAKFEHEKEYIIWPSREIVFYRPNESILKSYTEYSSPILQPSQNLGSRLV